LWRRLSEDLVNTTMPQQPWIQVEISSVCQAGCIDCNRQRTQWPDYDWTDQSTADWRINAGITGVRSHYPVDQWHQHVSQWRELRSVQFCGNVGDPMAHPHISDCVASVIQQHRHCSVDISTNGALGRLEQWDRLAHMGITVTFAVDGLEDTNHIYRRGVEWSRIRQRMTRFIEQGGSAEWCWVDFPWNRHQIDHARELAHSWGFRGFEVRSRYTATDQFDAHIVRVSQQPVSRESHPPTGPNPHHQHQHSDRVRQQWSQGLTVRPQCVPQDDTVAHRHPAHHINADGTVWPCCWMACVPFHHSLHEQWWYAQVIDQVGTTWNSLNHHHIDDIIDSLGWQMITDQSWHTDPQRSHTASSICLQHCGQCVTTSDS